jgi:hypothetical protein
MATDVQLPAEIQTLPHRIADIFKEAGLVEKY